MIASQAGLAIIRLSLAPLTLIWYGSTTDCRSAYLFNTVMLATANVGVEGIL